MNSSTKEVIDVLIKLSVESWRFQKLYKRLIAKMDAGEQKKYNSQLTWFSNIIQDSLNQVGIKIVNLEGQLFNTGMAVSPINIEEFDSSDSLVVDQMLEPVLMDENGVIKTGTVILRRLNS